MISMAEKTLFRKLAEIFEKLEKTSSSLAMIDILADFFPKISPEEIKISAYLLRGEISPPYEGLEIGMADKMVMRAIAKSANIEIGKIKDLFNKTGDLGLVVESLKSYDVGHRKIDGLSIEEVFEGLVEIAKTTGAGSQEKKLNLLEDLLAKTSGLEAKYIIRAILGTLRLGVGEMIFLYGLAKAFGNKKQKEVLEYAYNVLSDLGEVGRLVAGKGIGKIGEIKPKVGVPIRMMSANRIQDLKEVKKHIFGRVSVEDKYDGERIQAHIRKTGKTVLFSRRQENITHQYPDIIKGLRKSFKGKEAIVEGEVVAYDEKKDELLPFQILMSRRRKHKIEEYAEKIPARFFLFDLLYLDGKNFLPKIFKERREAIERMFREIGPIRFGRSAVVEELEGIEAYFADAVQRGNEGVMIKDWGGIYQAGSRGWLWIKFKKDYQKGLTDTFDLAVVGAIYGAGRRAGTYGSLLAAAYDPKTNEYYSFTKVGAGLTDDNLAKLPRMFEKYRLKEKSKLVETEMECDLWFEPKIVMEISGADITVSPVHSAAKEKIKTGGLALRFPRFLRWREDKSAEESTTVKEIYELYKKSV